MVVHNERSYGVEPVDESNLATHGDYDEKNIKNDNVHTSVSAAGLDTGEEQVAAQ